MMTIKEVREKNPEQLRSELNERQKHLFDLRSQAVTEKLEDPSQLRKTRKDIARILTVMRQREIEEGRPAGTEQQAASAEASAAGAEAPARNRARTRTPKRTRATKRLGATKRTPRAAKQKKTGTKPAARKPAARKTTKKTKAAKKTRAKASA